MEGVSLAFVDKERIVILCTTEEPSVEALTSALAAFDAKPDGMTRDDSLLF